MTCGVAGRVVAQQPPRLARDQLAMHTTIMSSPAKVSSQTQPSSRSNPDYFGERLRSRPTEAPERLEKG